MQYRLDDYARRHHLVACTYINKRIIAKFVPVMDNYHDTRMRAKRAPLLSAVHILLLPSKKIIYGNYHPHACIAAQRCNSPHAQLQLRISAGNTISI
jgi:hypothetical protein